MVKINLDYDNGENRISIERRIKEDEELVNDVIGKMLYALEVQTHDFMTDEIYDTVIGSLPKIKITNKKVRTHFDTWIGDTACTVDISIIRVKK